MTTRSVVMATITFTLGIVAGAALLPYFMTDEVQSEVHDLAQEQILESEETSQASAQMAYRATSLIEKVQLLQLPADKLPCQLWDRAKLEREIVLGSQEHFADQNPDVMDGPAGVLANNALTLFDSLGDRYATICLGV